MERAMPTVQMKQLGSAAIDEAAANASRPSMEPHLRSVPSDVASCRPRRVRKTRLTIYLSVDIIETLRNIAYWTKGATLAGLVEEALVRGIEARERMNGGPFLRRLEELKGGRPKRNGTDTGAAISG